MRTNSFVITIYTLNRIKTKLFALIYGSNYFCHLRKWQKLGKHWNIVDFMRRDAYFVFGFIK